MPPTTRELLLATANPHKVDELRAILTPALEEFDLRLLGLSDLLARGLGPLHEPEESGRTFEHNAAIKAISYAGQTGLTCLADDSGLEVDALDGRPGVISSHYFNDGRIDGAAAEMARAQRDALNNARVLRELEGVEFEGRTARFVCVMAVAATPQSARRDEPASPALITTFRATFEGRIGFPADASPDPALIIPRGGHGFGYDPLFLVAPAFTQTGAELSPELKNRISHRARAAQMLLTWLRAGGLDTSVSR